MYVNEAQAKLEMIEIGRLLYDRKLMVGVDGNFSVKIGENEVLITASGICKGRLTDEQITKIDLNGNVIYGMKPARDIRMHLALYNSRPEIKAIVHSHPPIGTGFALSQFDVKKLSMPEVFFELGEIAVADYATPRTAEVPKSLIKALDENPRACTAILANHGTIAFAENLYRAFYKLETLEMVLTAQLVAKILGSQRELSQDELDKVWKLVEEEKSEKAEK